MPRVLKAVAIWLFALIIPVQGMAAVAMPLCAPVQPAGLAVATGNALGVELATGPAVHQHAAMAHGTHSEHDVGHASDNAGGESDHSGHPMLKCCSAACAMAAALPASAFSTRAPTGSAAPLHPLAQFYSSVTPDGLDRPPKSFLA